MNRKHVMILVIALILSALIGLLWSDTAFANTVSMGSSASAAPAVL